VTAFAIGTVAALAALLALALLQISRQQHAAQAEREQIAARHVDEQARWAQERLALLNRVQRPDMLSMPPAEFTEPEPELDESNLVGQIQLNPEYGLDDAD
jgi:hypothetical protein